MLPGSPNDWRLSSLRLGKVQAIHPLRITYLGTFSEWVSVSTGTMSFCHSLWEASRPKERQAKVE